MEKKSAQLETYLAEQEAIIHSALLELDRTLNNADQPALDPAQDTRINLLEVLDKIENRRIENNIEIVNNTLEQLRLLVDRMDLLVTYRNIFEFEDAKDRTYTELQIMNESNAAKIADEYSMTCLTNVLKGKIPSQLYKDFIKEWAKLSERHVEIMDEEYEPKPSKPLKEPVLKYARDTEKYITTLFNDVHKTIESVNDQIRMIRECTERFPAEKRKHLFPLAEAAKQDFEAVLLHGHHVASEIDKLEKFVKGVKKFDQPTIAPFVRSITNGS